MKESNKGFVVRGAPWEKKTVRGGGGGGDKNEQSPGSRQKFSGGHGVDTSSAQDFPAFGGTNNDSPNNASKMINNDTIENSDNSPMNGDVTLVGEKNGDTITSNEQPIVWGPKRN